MRPSVIFRLRLTLYKHYRQISSRFVHTVAGDKFELPSTESTEVSENIIKDKLKQFFVSFKDGYTCFHIQNCHMCLTKKLGSLRPDIFINKTTGFFLCENCKLNGDWQMFIKLLNKAKNKEPVLVKNELKYTKNKTVWRGVVESNFALSDFTDEELMCTLKNFRLINLDKKTVEKLQIRINKTKDTLYFPLFCSLSDIVGYKTFNLEGESLTTPRMNCPGFLQYSKKSKCAVIVADIPDFFALVSQNLPYQVLCLPYGIANLPQATLPFLESYDKIILWLGGGSALNSVGNFGNKLKNKRCFVVRPTESQKSGEIALKSHQNIRKILEQAKPMWHENIITFNSLKDEVLAELQNKEVMCGVQWKRFPILNKILKGHRRGELTVITGPTGSGKTTFMSEYSLDLAMQGVNTLWGSFEIKNSRLARMMLQQFAGRPLSQNIQDFEDLASKFEKLPLFFMTFHGQHNIFTVMDAVEHCSYTSDIAHVIIDNVQFMIEVAPDSYHIDRFWKQDHLIQCFRSFATKNNCHVTLVMHPKKGFDGVDLSTNSIFGGAKAAQEADNVFIIQNKKHKLANSSKLLQIAKNRYCGDLGVIPLNFNKESLSFTCKNIEEVHQTETNFNDDFEVPNIYSNNETKYKFDSVTYEMNKKQVSSTNQNRIVY